MLLLGIVTSAVEVTQDTHLPSIGTVLIAVSSICAVQFVITNLLSAKDDRFVMIACGYLILLRFALKDCIERSGDLTEQELDLVPLLWFPYVGVFGLLIALEPRYLPFLRRNQDDKTDASS